jgi:hypothetical protein
VRRSEPALVLAALKGHLEAMLGPVQLVSHDHNLGRPLAWSGVSAWVTLAVVQLCPRYFAQHPVVKSALISQRESYVTEWILSQYLYTPRNKSSKPGTRSGSRQNVLEIKMIENPTSILDLSERRIAPL